MAAYLSPIGNEQQSDSNGAPVSGALINTYLAGTTTPVVTYTDAAGLVPQSNPIVCNAAGYPASPIFLPAGVAVKMVFTTSVASGSVAYRPPVDNITGVNDPSFATTVSEWTAFSGTPLFISATSFSVTGDQTNILSVGRQLRTTNTGGTIYSTITASVFGSVTTVTVANVAGVLDAGLSAVSYGLLNPINPSLPKSAAARSSLGAGTFGDTVFTSASQLAALNLLGTPMGPVRQTVASGPVDASGFASFGGATGATTVTATGTLVATASQAQLNRSGSITNPSWTGLSTNGTMYLFLDVAADGTCTTGSTTLAPVYQWGGTYSTTNLQNTFNIQEMTMKVGNGATASAVYRVFVGEVTVAGAVVSAITWYALMGQYDSGFTATLPGTTTQTLKSHNLGVYPGQAEIIIENTTTDAGYAVGERLSSSGGVASFSSVFSVPLGVSLTTKAMNVSTLSGGAFLVTNKTSGSATTLTAANWKYKFTARRGW